MASLMSLSTELKLIIIECLEAGGGSFEKDEKDERFELWKAQEDDWPRVLPTTNMDILNLSCANRLFRKLTVPFLFKTVILRNTEASARSLQTLATGPYASLVKRIEYLARVDLPGCYPEFRRDKDVDSFAPKAEDFPAELEDILANLNRFENLNTVGVEFPWDEFQYLGGWFFEEFGRTESLQAECEEGWRDLMAKSYTALTKNDVGIVKKLALRNVVPQEVNIWRSDEWHRFLGELEGFEISLRGGNNGAGWCISLLDCYARFVSTLPELFFDHLRKVRDVRFFATDEGPVRGGRINAHLFNFSPTSMPNLQRVSHSYIFLSRGFVDFLTSHAHTLQSIRFYNAYVEPGHELQQQGRELLEGEFCTWKPFFDAMQHAEPAFPELQEFDMDWGVNYGISGSFGTIPKEFRLPYVSVDDKYGDIQWEGADEGPEFLDNDLIAYREFQRLVETNRKGI